MIYSIGYQQLTPSALREILAALKVEVLVDTRSVPASRRPGFSKSALANVFPEYSWRGNTLGGRGNGVTLEGIVSLRLLNKTVLLMCQEEAPADCHRHRMIAVRLLPEIDVVHIFRDELVFASELEASINENRDYAFTPAPWSTSADSGSGDFNIA